MANKTTKTVKIKNKKEIVNKEIVSDGDLLIDARESNGLELSGKMEIKSKGDTKIIGNGKTSEEMDKDIRNVLKNEWALSLYEKNKKYGPSVTYMENKYNVNAKEAEITKGTIVAGNKIMFNTKSMIFTDSIMAAGEEIYLTGLKELDCANSYIGAKRIYTDNLPLLEEMIEDCKVEGEIQLINNQGEL